MGPYNYAKSHKRVSANKPVELGSSGGTMVMIRNGSSEWKEVTQTLSSTARCGMCFSHQIRDRIPVEER